MPVDPFSLDQRWLPENLAPGLSAVDLGWVAADDTARAWGDGPDPDQIDDLPWDHTDLAVSDPADLARAERHQQWREVVPEQVEEEVVRAILKGHRPADIAAGTGMLPRTVLAIYARAQKRAISLAGKMEARNAQLVEIDAVKERVLRIVLAEPELKEVEGGRPKLVYPRLDPKLIDALHKLWTRRAILTGADQPAKLQVQADDGSHQEAEDAVDRVGDYVKLAEAIMKTGFGSGRVVDAEGWDEVPRLVLNAGEPADDAIFSPE